MNAQQAENLRILIRHMETNVKRTLEMPLPSLCAIAVAREVPALVAQGLPAATSLWVPRSYHDEVAQDFFGLLAWHHPSLYYGRLFGASLNGKRQVTPQEWAAEARKVLAENGYSMDDDNTWARDKVAALCVVDPAPAWDHA